MHVGLTIILLLKFKLGNTEVLKLY